MNKVVLLGRLTKDPEIRYTPTQKVVASFVIAVDRPFTNKETGKKEADFIPVVLWGKAAELVGNSCAKGHRLLVEGRLQIRNFDAKDGTKHWVTEIVANNVEFIERRNTGSLDGQGNQQIQGQTQQPAAEYNSGMESMGDEVPFF